MRQLNSKIKQIDRPVLVENTRGRSHENKSNTVGRQKPISQPKSVRKSLVVHNKVSDTLVRKKLSDLLPGPVNNHRLKEYEDDFFDDLDQIDIAKRKLENKLN